MYNGYLTHSGVRGMKWGVRKQPDIVGQGGASAKGKTLIGKNAVSKILGTKSTVKPVTKIVKKKKKVDPFSDWPPKREDEHSVLRSLLDPNQQLREMTDYVNRAQTEHFVNNLFGTRVISLAKR